MLTIILQWFYTPPNCLYNWRKFFFFEIVFNFFVMWCWCGNDFESWQDDAFLWNFSDNIKSAFWNSATTCIATNKRNLVYIRRYHLSFVLNKYISNKFVLFRRNFVQTCWPLKLKLKLNQRQSVNSGVELFVLWHTMLRYLLTLWPDYDLMFNDET